MQQEHRYQRGDAVQLKQGGPVMHVVGTSHELCYCNWCDEEGELHHGTFMCESLQPIDARQLP